MDEALHTNVLAIDGGGTRCRAALSMAGHVLTVETGAANVMSDFDGGVAQIVASLSRLAMQAGVGLEALLRYPAFVGLAGVTGPEITQRLRAALPLKVLRINDDRPAALRGALGVREGVIVHCERGLSLGRRLPERSDSQAGGARFWGMKLRRSGWVVRLCGLRLK